MEIFMTLKGGERVAVRAISYSIDYEDGVPAGEARLMIPYGEICGEPVSVDFVLNGEVVFRGIIDVFEVYISENTRYLYIEARSYAGVLLDNEANPTAYDRPNDDLIFCNHLQPYGFKTYKGDSKRINKLFNMPKGLSEWSVLKNYCIAKYGCEPKILQDGTVIFNGGESKNYVFSNTSENDGYYILSDRHNRCELISEVKVKRDRGGGYDYSLKSDIAEAEGIKAVRYYDSTVKGGLGVAGAQKLIDEAEQNSRSIELRYAALMFPMIGGNAVIYDSRLGKIDGLYIYRVRVYHTEQGERTSIYLKKRVSEG